MTDINWTDRLSEYLDGSLTPAEQAACEAWLAGSADGRDLLADLRGVVAKAKTLPDASVPEAIWAGISAGIKADSHGRAPSDVRPIGSARRATSSTGRRWSFTPMQMAAAAVILVAVGVGAGVLARRSRPVTGLAQRDPAATTSGIGTPVSSTASDRSYRRAVEDLEQVLDQNRDKLDPATVRVLESSITKIDAALAEAEQALAADPKSPYLNDHLARIRRKKLDILRQSAALIRAS